MDRALDGFGPPKAAGLLDGLKTWMARNNTAVMAVLCPIVGVKLIGDAITGFSG